MIAWFKESKLMTGVAILGYALVPMSIVAYSVWVNSGTKHPVETVSQVSASPALYELGSYTYTEPQPEPEPVPTPQPALSKPSQPVISVASHREEPHQKPEPKEEHHDEENHDKPKHDENEETDPVETPNEDEEDSPSEETPDVPDPIELPVEIIIPVES